LIDKSQLGKKTLFRIEIWIRKGYDLANLDELKVYLGKVFGSSVTETKISP
jgi:hypothetical protein